MPQARIRDRATGKEILVDSKDLPKYGINMQPPEPKKNMVQQLTDMFLPATKKFAETVTGSMALGAQSKATEDLNKNLQVRQKSILDQMGKEVDPRKKTELSTMAKQTTQEMKKSSEQLATGRKNLKNTLGLDSETFTKKDIAKKSIATATELGGFLFPSGTAQKGLQVTGKTAVLAGKGFKESLARNAVEGLITGGLFTASNEEQQELDKIITGSSKGAITDVGMGAVGRLFGAAGNFIFNKIPLANRAAAFGNAPVQLIEESFKRGTPGSYRKMGVWAKKTGQEAERELQKIKVDGGFGLTDLFGEDLRAQTNGLFATKDLVDHLKSINQTEDADKLEKIFTKMANVPVSGNKVQGIGLLDNTLDLQDTLFLKRAFDKGSSFAKGQATEKMAKKVALRTNISNKIRGSIRDKSEEAANLLDIEHFSKNIQPFAEKAANSRVKKYIPSLYEINTLLTGLALSGGIGYATGSPELASLPIVGLIGYRTLNDPRIANFLYKTGQKMESPTNERLREFLRKGVVQQTTNGL